MLYWWLSLYGDVDGVVGYLFVTCCCCVCNKACATIGEWFKSQKFKLWGGLLHFLSVWFINLIATGRFVRFIIMDGPHFH